jgi:formate/nitrite transporter FocA (FNT family)
MGASFGVALTLVLFAGSGLFTGNAMVLAVGALSGRATWLQLGNVWAWFYAGNLVGSLDGSTTSCRSSRAASSAARCSLPGCTGSPHR